MSPGNPALKKRESDLSVVVVIVNVICLSVISLLFTCIKRIVCCKAMWYTYNLGFPEEELFCFKS